MTDWSLIRHTLRVEEALEGLDIPIAKRDGAELLASCPLPSHGGPDRSPSFSVNAEKLVYNCFGCGGGDLPSLVIQIRGGTREEGVRFLAAYSDMADPETEEYVNMIKALMEQAEQTHERRRSLPYEVHPILPRMESRFRLDPLPYAHEYCAGRGISGDVTELLNIRFDENYLRAKANFSGPAVLIPHYFDGQLVGWQERWLDHGTPGFPKQIGKYTNTSSFPKTKTLYNFDRVADNTNAVLVVESPMTVAKLLSVGKEAVATFGASVSAQQIFYLQMFHQGVILSYDNDGVGRNATQRLIDSLKEHVPVEVLPPPPGKKADLGDLPVDALLSFIETKVPYELYESDY